MESKFVIDGIENALAFMAINHYDRGSYVQHSVLDLLDDLEKNGKIDLGKYGYKMRLICSGNMITQHLVSLDENNKGAIFIRQFEYTPLYPELNFIFSFGIKADHSTGQLSVVQNPYFTENSNEVVMMGVPENNIKN